MENNMLIIDYLKNNAKKYAKEEAIVFLQKKYIDPNDKNKNKYSRSSLTWQEFYGMSNRISNLLFEAGIKKGDKIAIILENCLEWLPIYFGILSVGAIAVPVNYNNGYEEICHCLKLADCNAVFLRYGKNTDKIYNKFNDRLKYYFIDEYVPSYGQSVEKILLAHSFAHHAVAISIEDDAAIYFSSGTTGKSKAILLSHSSISSSGKISLAHHFQTHIDRFLCLTPLYHTGSKMHWFGSLIVGGSIIIFNSSSPNNIVEVISKEKITIVFLLVPFIQDILDSIDVGDINLNIYPLDCLRLMHTGAQPIPSELISRWHNHFPQVQYDTDYGLTEATGPGCVFLGINNFEKLESTGKPDENWDVKIVDENGDTMKNGLVGELILKGPGIMRGYYNDIVATCQTLKNDWLYTGDLAYASDDGYIYIVGRKKDLIISGGENIYPIQIEDYIRKFDAVKDVAVIGIPNKRMGEVVGAIVELKSGSICSKSDIFNYCTGLPAYQRPCKIVFAPILRNPTGKVDKVKLYNLYLKSKLQTEANL